MKYDEPIIKQNVVKSVEENYGIAIEIINFIPVGEESYAYLITDKKKNLAYLLAPMIFVFIIVMNVNIISLMLVAKFKDVPSETGLIIGFSIFTVIYCGFLWLMLRRLKK